MRCMDKDESSSAVGVHHRPPLDGAVFKLRYRRASGATDTIYYSDPKTAHAVAGVHRQRGSLLYFARYTHAEVLS